jgi:hypothetical protein
MYKAILVASIAAGLFASSPARAQSDPTTQQVAQEASQGQDPITATEITKYIDQHQDVVSAIIKMYSSYIKQLQTLTNDTNSGDSQNLQTITAALSSALASNTSASTNSNNSGTSQQGAIQPSSSAQEGVIQPSSGTQEGVIQPSSGVQAGSVQPSSGVQAGSVQPSGGLVTGHLAGYPSLPAVDPVSAVKQMTQDQIDYAAKVQKENQARKQSLMAQPAGMGN